MEIRCDAFHVVKAEGEKHSLVIKEMRLSNAGSYCATAVNAAGRASCSATLYIQSGEAGPEPAFKYWYQFDYQVNIQPVLPIPIQIPIILTYKGSFYGGEQCVMIYEMSHLPKILNLFNTFQ